MTTVETIAETVARVAPQTPDGEVCLLHALKFIDKRMRQVDEPDRSADFLDLADAADILEALVDLHEALKPPERAQ